MSYIMQVAVGRRDHLIVNGGDYPTPDGSAVNLGTGAGSSVLDVVRAATAAVGREFR